jgi:acyl carrier protein
MTHELVLEKLTLIFRDVLDQEHLVLKKETTANDVEDWDSLSHISIISSIESEFRMKFSLAEIQKLKNVGEMVELILMKKV